MKNRFFVGDELETVTPKGSEKLVIEDIVIERTGEHVGVVNVPMERVRIPCGGKLQAATAARPGQKPSVTRLRYGAATGERQKSG